MKYFSLLVGAVLCFFTKEAIADQPTRGSVLELHSCELYAGGCIVSSEATLGGRYMLRAWNFDQGSFQGCELKGLSVAVLQSSSENLATPNADPVQSLVYLPLNASDRQRTALLAWLKSEEGALGRNFEMRQTPILFDKTNKGYTLSVGNFVSVQTAPPETCVTGACGEALWYSPRAKTSVFTVAVDQSSTVNEPLLRLKWTDAGRRTVFLGKFGKATPAHNLYVSAAELCGKEPAVF